MDSKFKKEINTLIGEGKTKEALELLRGSIFSKEIKDNILMISNRFNSLEKDKVRGIINREQVLLEESRIVESILTLMELSENSVVPDSLTNFFSKYTEILEKKYSEVNFVNLGIKASFQKERKKIEDIFIEPDIHEKQIDDTQIPIDIKKCISKNNHLVILGDPGCGKSLLTKYVILDILRNQKSMIPFRIILKDYLNYKLRHNKNIVGFIHEQLHKDYHYNFGKNSVEDFLNEYETIFFFDGLDEIFDTNLKINIRDDITTFNISYPNSVTIVTSRTSGYYEAPLEDGFTTCHIAPFDRGRIKSFIQKWYTNISVPDYKEEKALLLKDIFKINNELISNPLLLTLIIILFRNNLKLPESRLEIYQSVTETLVDKWEDSKNLNIKLNKQILQKRKSILTDLAFWQYELISKKPNNKLTYNKVLAKVTSIISEKLELEDFEEANQYAKQFLEYARKRSIYIENDFVHKTFIEYYTARYIYSSFYLKIKGRKKMHSLFKKYAHMAYWYVVMELLINLIDSVQNDNTEINDLFKRIVKSNIKAIPLILGNFPSTQNASFSLKKNIIHQAINYIKKELEYAPLRPWDEESEANHNVFQTYKKIRGLSYDEDYVGAINEYFKSDELLIDIDDEALKRILAVEGELIYFNHNLEYNDRDAEFEKLMRKDKALLSTYFNVKKVFGKPSITEYIRLCYNHFGEDEVFCSTKSYFTYKGDWLEPIVEYLDFFAYDKRFFLEERLNDLEEISAMIPIESIYKYIIEIHQISAYNIGDIARTVTSDELTDDGGIQTRYKEMLLLLIWKALVRNINHNDDVLRNLDLSYMERRFKIKEDEYEQIALIMSIASTLMDTNKDYELYTKYSNIRR